MVNLSKSLAIEYSKQAVRVKALGPGNVKTPLSAKVVIPDYVDLGLLGKMFPLLDAAQPSEISGAAVPIDGGQVAG